MSEKTTATREYVLFRYDPPGIEGSHNGWVLTDRETGKVAARFEGVDFIAMTHTLKVSGFRMRQTPGETIFYK